MRETNCNKTSHFHYMRFDISILVLSNNIIRVLSTVRHKKISLVLVCKYPKNKTSNLNFKSKLRQNLKNERN